MYIHVSFLYVVASLCHATTHKGPQWK